MRGEQLERPLCHGLSCVIIPSVTSLKTGGGIECGVVEGQGQVAVDMVNSGVAPGGELAGGWRDAGGGCDGDGCNDPLVAIPGPVQL